MNPRPSVENSVTFRRIIAYGITVFSLGTLLVLGPLFWLVRDGLGPGAIESSGVEALRRFMADFWPIAVLCFFCFVIAFFIAPRRSTRKESVNPKS